jgi:hypothetical protein
MPADSDMLLDHQQLGSNMVKTADKAGKRPSTRRKQANNQTFKMAAMQTQLAQQKHCRSLLQPTGSRLQSCRRHSCVPPLPARSQQHAVLPPWQTCGSSSIAVAAATPAAAAHLPEPDRFIDCRLQRLCKNVLVGVAAAAAWSVAASVFGGSTSPLASLTIATQPGASGQLRL